MAGKKLNTYTPQNLLDNFSHILQQVDENTHTILLSSEGFYNHWWDFPQESKEILLELQLLFDVHIWVWFRDPLSFAKSFYKQCLRNPNSDKVNCYGKDLSFTEMLTDPWFKQRLDYLSFIKECDDLFGKNAISIYEYQHDTVETVSKIFNLNTPHDNPTPRKNASMSDITAELYRVVNRIQLSAKDKEKLIPSLKNLDDLLKIHKTKDELNHLDLELVEALKKKTTEMMIEIDKRFIKC